MMKYFASFFSTMLCCASLLAQNVGIGTSLPDKGKLMVVGTAGPGSNTVAFFGANAGISIQEAWPTIGFNQYRASPTGFGRAISSGYGMHMTFNHNAGDFVLYRNGIANAAGASFPQQGEILAFLESGYSLRLNSQLPNARVEIPDKMFSAQTGKMNLVPLGIISVELSYFPESLLDVSASNIAGTLLSSLLGQRNGTQCRLTLNLNPSETAGYNSFVLIPGLNFTQANSASLFSIETVMLNESPRKIRVSVLMASESSQINVNGNILVYGVML